ncbi:MAG: hypothetical protein A3K03_06045 [Bdellovibrionales bacterium RIFOXYD1_FULL_44_7]|nr:MAG: hypothetical protein A3K03_06045 [Bdellovibrionales bacterium RIFOXYD1_FULL_44_7]
MILNEDPTYYDLLEVAPDASPQELRAAYLRAKSAYKKDSVALYTLITEEETDELLHRIEEAYQILSNLEKRREYDRSHGLLTIDETVMTKTRAPFNKKIISIDRVPPMENIDNEADILVAPKTDFDTETIVNISVPRSETEKTSQRNSSVPIRHSSDPANEQLIVQEVAQETEWHGHFLRKVRETKRVSIEELSEFTKISKTYLLAIEEENYSKLPAQVYLRGFVTQVAKFLKLPHDKVAAAYISRYNLTAKK